MLDALQSVDSVAARPAAKLRVVSISHSVIRAGASRMRYEALASDPALDLTVVVPELWHEYGQAEAAEPSRTGLKVVPHPVRLTRGGPARWYLHHYPGLRRLLTTLRPDVIHLWEEPWSLVALQAARLRDRHLPGAALLLETDQNIARRLPFGFEWIRRHTLARTELLIARGPDALAVSRERGYRGAYQYVEYAINEAVFYPRPTAARDASAPLRLGYVGRLVAEKGLDDVLAAMGASAAPVELLLLGAGPERAVLEARARALGVADRVQFLEPRAPEGVAEFICSLDALVLVSRTTRTWKEQFGRVVMEAHACGIPVIGSSSGSIPDVVGQGGWIVPESDPAAIAALLDRLAGSRGELAERGARGRRDSMRRFSQAAVSGNLREGWLRAAELRRTKLAAAAGQG